MKNTSKKKLICELLCKDYDIMLMHLYQLHRTSYQGSKYHENDNIISEETEQNLSRNLNRTEA